MVKADNVSALTMVASMKAKSRATNLIARELALDLADGAFRPDFVAHIPGISNIAADALSRKFVPDTSFQLPWMLQGVPEVSCPERSDLYFTTLVI